MTAALHLVPLIDPAQGEQTDIRAGTRKCLWCHRDRQYRSEYCSEAHAERAAKAVHLGTIDTRVPTELELEQHGVDVRNPSPGREPTEASDVFQPSLAAETAHGVQMFQLSFLLMAVGMALFVGFCLGVNL